MYSRSAFARLGAALLLFVCASTTGALADSTIPAGALSRNIVTWYGTGNESVNGAWASCGIVLPKLYLPVHLLAWQRVYWALGFRTLDAVSGVPFDLVSRSSDGNWSCLGRSDNIVTRAGSTSFLVKALDPNDQRKSRPSAICIGGGRALTPSLKYGDPEASVFCMRASVDTTDGVAVWVAAAPLPQLVVVAASASIPFYREGQGTASSFWTVVVGGWRGDGGQELWVAQTAPHSSSNAVDTGTPFLVPVRWHSVPTSTLTFSRVGPVVTWLPSKRVLMMGGGDLPAGVSASSVLDEPLPSSETDITLGIRSFESISMVDTFLVDLAAPLGEIVRGIEGGAEGVSNLKNETNETGLEVSPAAITRLQLRLPEIRAPRLPTSYSLSAFAVAESYPASGSLNVSENEGTFIVDLLHFLSGSRVFAQALLPDAYLDVSSFNARVHKFGSDLWQSIPVPQAPVSYMGLPQWDDSVFGHMLAMSTTSGNKLLRGSPVGCQINTSCVKGASYSSTCTASPFDAVCKPCTQCKPGLEFVSTPCSVKTDAECLSCLRCRSDEVALLPCGYPGAPNVRVPLCIAPSLLIARAGTARPWTVYITACIVAAQVVAALTAVLAATRCCRASKKSANEVAGEHAGEWGSVFSQGAKEDTLGAPNSGNNRSAPPPRTFRTSCSILAAAWALTAAGLTISLALALGVWGLGENRPVNRTSDEMGASLTVLLSIAIVPLGTILFIGGQDAYTPRLKLWAAIRRLFGFNNGCRSAAPWGWAPVALLCLWRPQMLMLAHSVSFAAGSSAPAASSSSKASSANKGTLGTHNWSLLQLTYLRRMILGQLLLLDLPLLAASLVFVVLGSAAAATRSGSNDTATLLPILMFLLQLWHVCYGLLSVDLVRNENLARLLEVSEQQQQHRAISLEDGDDDDNEGLHRNSGNPSHAAEQSIAFKRFPSLGSNDAFISSSAQHEDGSNGALVGSQAAGDVGVANPLPSAVSIAAIHAHPHDPDEQCAAVELLATVLPQDRTVAELLAQLRASACTPEGRRLASMRTFFSANRHLIPAATSAVARVPLSQEWREMLRALELTASELESSSIQQGELSLDESRGAADGQRDS